MLVWNLKQQFMMQSGHTRLPRTLRQYTGNVNTFKKVTRALRREVKEAKRSYSSNDVTSGACGLG